MLLPQRNNDWCRYLVVPYHHYAWGWSGLTAWLSSRQMSWVTHWGVAVATLTMFSGHRILAQGGQVDRVPNRNVIPGGMQSAFLSRCRAMSPIAVEWSRTRTTTLPDQEFREAFQLPVGNRTFFRPQKVEYWYQNGMVRANIWNWRSIMDADFNFLREEQDVRRVAFNGDLVFTEGGEEEQDIHLRIITGKQLAEESPTGLLVPADVFRYFNISLPTSPTGLLVGCTPYTDSLAQQQGATVSIDDIGKDQSEVVLTIQLQGGTRHQFAVDNKHQNMITRYTCMSADGGVLVRAFPDDYHPLTADPEVLIPRVCRVEWFQRGKSERRDEASGPLFVDEYKIRIVSQEPIPQEFFTMRNLRPGTLVIDSTIPGVGDLPGGRIEYRVPADIKQLDQAIEHAKQGGIPGRRFSVSTAILVVVNLLIAVVAVVYFIVRRSK